MRAFVDRCWRLYKDGADWNNTENIEKYSRKSTAAKLASLLDSITEQ